MSETATDTREQDATRELEQAERGVEEILGRIKDSDEQVGPEDLEAAESRVRFAKARIEGLKRRKEEEAEQARRERIDVLKKRALALDEGAVGKLEEKARKALDAYVAAATAHRTELNGIVQELDGLRPLPDDLELEMHPDGYGLTSGPERRRPITPIAACTVMAHETLQAHMPRQETGLPIDRYK